MFIGRRADGTIYGAWTTKQSDDADHQRIEEVENDNVEYVAFRDRPLTVMIDPYTAQLESIKERLLVLESKTR